MTAGLPVLSAGRPPFTPKGFMVLFSVRDYVGSRVIIRLEGSSQLYNRVSSSGIESATVQLVAQCLNILYYIYTRMYVYVCVCVCVCV
jgi:hypothetical protein